jgi:SAM-dependent methyltransferase
VQPEGAFDRAAVRRHLQGEYHGVFDDQMVDAFMDDYVDGASAAPLVARLLQVHPQPHDVLDIGCGYGAFVLAARREGMDARGVDLSDYELGFASATLRGEHPASAAGVFVKADALALPFADGSFDLVTAWNVLEHVPDLPRLVAEVHRVLRPGGALLAVAPNYASFRREAHYQVPWAPMLPRALGSAYLRRLRRDPTFFETSIHYRTRLGVQRALRERGFRLQPAAPPQLAKLTDIDAVQRPALRRLLSSAQRAGLLPVVRALVRAGARNPLGRTIDVLARKA